MEKRRRHRIERRLACSVTAGGSRAPGIICDVSEIGLFVATPANPELNSIVELLFSETDEQPEFCVEAGVARTLDAVSRFQSKLPVGSAGIGLEVIPPRDEFERWVVCLPRPVAPTRSSTLAPLGSRPQGAMRRFRVRLIRQDRPGTQILTLRCESEAAARAKALARLSGIWRIAESQPV